MLMGVYSVWDDKAAAFIPPFFFPHEAQAVRAFADCVNDPSHAFGRNPHDYTLFRIAKWDDASGLFVTQESTTLIANGPGVLRRAK